MKIFDLQLLRLKQAVGVIADQDVAALLGMTKEAFHQRKKRDAFPTDKLGALAATRPELNIDVQYVLAGIPATVSGVKQQLAAEGRLHEYPALLNTVGDVQAALGSKKSPKLTSSEPLTAEEQTMLSYFRQSSPEVRRAALGALLGASPAAAAAAPHVGSQHNSYGGSAQHYGDVHGNLTLTKRKRP